jgi:hypothetical protein
LLWLKKNKNMPEQLIPTTQQVRPGAAPLGAFQAELPGVTPGAAAVPEQVAQPGRLARASEWAAGVVSRVVDVGPSIAAKVERSGALGVVERQASHMSGRARLGVLAAAHATRFAAGIHEARRHGLSGQPAFAYAGARTIHHASQKRSH